MSGILEIIFQGFLEWAYTLILEIWEFFSTAILNIMRMDFSYLESHIPILPVLQQSFLAVGWALLIGNLVFQSVRSMLTGLGFDAEDPKLLFSRTFVFSFLLVASPQICDIALNMTAVVIRMLEMPNAVVITTLSEGAFAGLGTAWLLVIICGLVVMYQSVKLFIEMAERYFILSMLTITSPMAFGLGGSRSTSDIFTNWCRMYGSMCLMMAMNVVFIKILLSVLAYSPTGPDVLPWMVLVMAVVRTAKKFDSIISRLGLNPAITNEPRMPGMLSIMVARTMMSGAAKVISQNGASGAGRSGGANPPPGGGYGQGNGGGQGSGGGGRNDSRNRNFNNNRDNGKGGRRDRNGNSPAPEGAPSSGGRKRDSGSANPDNPDAPRNRDASRKPDAAPSGSNTGNGGQKQTERSGKGYRRNGSESGGAQRNRSYRKRNNPPDSPPGAGGQDASQRSRQDTARDSSSSQFREQRQSSETSFTRNGETVAGNGGGGQFQREQGFAEGGRFDTRRTSAPPGGQHAPRYSGRRQPPPDSENVSGTASGGAANNAASNAGASEKGRSANPKSTRYTNRPKNEASQRTTPDGAPTPLSASRTRTDEQSRRDATENRTSATDRPDVSSSGSSRTSVTDSRFTQRGEIASQGKAKDGTPPPPNDAPPASTPDAAPRNVTAPITLEKPSPAKEGGSDSGETRFSNRPASSATTTTAAAHVTSTAKSGAPSRDVPPPSEKTASNSTDTRFTNRTVSANATGADSTQTHAVESRTAPATTPDAAPRNVTAPVAPAKETDSASKEMRFTSHPAPASQTPAGTGGGTFNGVVSQKETDSNAKETRLTNRSASLAASAHTTASGVTSNSAAASKETDSASKEMRFTNRSASQTPTPASGVASNNADSGETDSSAERTRFTNRSSPATVIPAPPMSMPTGGGTSPDKNANADSGETRFTSRPALSTVVPASVTPTDGTSNGAVAGKETDANSAETRFSNRSASANVIPASPMPTTTGGGTSPDKNTNSDSGETRFTNRSVSSNVGSAPPANGATSSGETDSKPNGTRFTGRPAAPDSSSLASAGGVTPRVNSGTTPDRPPHDRDRVNRTEKRPASVSPSGNGGNADEKPGGAQIGASSTAPPSHVVSSGKADGISVTESCFSQRNSAKAAGQSRPAAPIPTPAPKADSPHGNATGGASAYETRQSSRETRDGGTSERAPVTVPSASAKPERGEASGASDAATANPSRPGRSSSNNVPRPPMSGGGAEQNATRQSARDNAGQKSERTENGASAPHPAAVAPHVNSGDNNRPTRPGRTAMENHSEPAPVQRTFASGANASAETLHSGESRVSAKQPNGTDHASANPQRPASFNHNAVPPRPVTPGEASHTIETRREKDVTPRSATPPNASERQNNPPRQGQSPRTVHVSANAAPTRPDAGRTERRADGRPQPDGRSAPRSRTSSDTAAGQRTSQTTYSFNNGVPPRSNTGTANRANVESPARRDNASTPRPSISPDTAAGRQSRQPGQQSGRPNQAREGQRTPQPTHSHDNYGSAPRPDRGAAERNDARRPAAQPQAAPRPLARDMANGRYIEQRGQQRTPDTRNADSYRRAPVPNDAAGNPNAAPRQNSERRPNPVPARGGYYDAEWRPAPARRENGAPQPPRRDGKEPLRGGVTERGRTEKPSDSGREKRPLFDFFGFGGGKRK